MKYKLLKNLSLSIISLIIFFTLAEAFTRLLWHPEIENIHYGVILEGSKRTLTHEGILYKTNSLGLRNKEISFDNKNTIRILALGDSFIWGDGLNEDELVTVKLENKLNKNNLKKTEIINAAISGNNTKNEYEQLARLYPIYNPDLVILFFFTNDVLSTDSSNRITSWKVNTNDFLRHNSKFYAFLYYSIKNFLSEKSGTPSLFLPSDYFDLDDSKPGWVNFKNNFNEIRYYCNQNNTGLLFVSIPTLTNLNEHYPYIELRNKVTSFVQSTSTPFYDLFDSFSKFQARELWVNQQNKHWNVKATTIAAEVLSEFIIENKLLSTAY